MATPKKPTILFCPLNWGLGHIARDVPLITDYIAQGHRVVVATEEPLTTWIKDEIPGIETDHFPGPAIRYSPGNRQLPVLMRQLPAMVRGMIREKKHTRQLVKKHHPELIVSDNRYGARCKGVRTVIITHQLLIKLPPLFQWLEWPLHLLVKRLVSRFHECWIPDFSRERSLAGDLVHKYPLPDNARLIGPLSRFNREKNSADIGGNEKRARLLGIISGPEPQRSIFEKALKENMIRHGIRATLVTGQPGKKISKAGDKLLLRPNLTTCEMARAIAGHEILVCRSGYSTLMDLYFLKKTAWLVPTPGQPEQEYLAQYHAGKKTHRVISQDAVPSHLFRPLA